MRATTQQTDYRPMRHSPSGLDVLAALSDDVSGSLFALIHFTTGLPLIYLSASGPAPAHKQLSPAFNTNPTCAVVDLKKVIELKK